MKRSLIIPVLIALLIAALLCGCGAPAAQEAQPAPAETETAQTQEQSQEAAPEQTPAVVLSGEVYWQNNGGYFLGLDHYVFFREYADKSFCEPITYGEFLPFPQPDTPVKLRVYDAETRTFAAEYPDDGMGGLWYSDGLIWSQYSDGELFHVYTLTPDGREKKDVTFGEVKGVSGDGRLVCVQGSEAVREQGRFSLWQDGGMIASVVPGDSETFLPCGFADDVYLFAVQDFRTESTYIKQLDASGKVLTLGKVPCSDESTIYLPEFEQLLPDGEQAHLLFSWYEGSGHFLSKSCAVTVTLGKEDSVEEIPLPAPASDAEGPADKPPVLFLGGPGDLVVVPEKAETAQLSEVTYGDLCYLDSPYSALRLVPGFIETDPYENGGQIIQTAETVGDSLYLMVADCSREPDFDIGWRAAYGLKEMTYYRVPIQENSAAELLGSVVSPQG